MTQMDLKKKHISKEEQHRNEEYAKRVKQRTPVKQLFPQMAKAFLVGGTICTLGQVIMFVATTYYGLTKQDAGAWCSIILVFLSASLTGIGVYAKIVDFGGAGALVPISGFANSVCAPAIEYQKEGQIFGIGCKIFTIAGPVILYGIFSSWILGVIYWIMKMIGVASL